MSQWGSQLISKALDFVFVLDFVNEYIIFDAEVCEFNNFDLVHHRLCSTAANRVTTTCIRSDAELTTDMDDEVRWIATSSMLGRVPVLVLVRVQSTSTGTRVVRVRGGMAVSQIVCIFQAGQRNICQN